MADAPDLGSGVNDVGVQVPLSAPSIDMREWLSGRALPCQGRYRGSESRLPLHTKKGLIRICIRPFFVYCFAVNNAANMHSHNMEIFAAGRCRKSCARRLVAVSVVAVNRRRFCAFFRDFAVAGRLLLPATVKLVVPRGGSFVLSDGVRQSSLSAWRRFVSGVLSAFSQVACVTVQSFARGVILW